MRAVARLALLLVLAACVESGPPPVAKPEAKVRATTELSGTARSTGSPANPRIRYAGGDGSSLARAIVIEGAAGEADGVQSEYDWIAMNLPGWKPASQALLQNGGRVYDLLTLHKSGATRQVCFDITGFFGRF